MRRLVLFILVMSLALSLVGATAIQWPEGQFFQSSPATAAPKRTTREILSASENVRLVGQIGGEAHTVAIQDNYAYIGLGPRLIILDVSDSADPEIVGRSDVLPVGEEQRPNYVSDVAVVGDYAYIAAFAAGLRIYDVSGPTQPTEVGSYDARGTYGLAVEGNYAYLAGGSSFMFVNIADPTQPVEIEILRPSEPNQCYDVTKEGSYAYFSCGTDGLWIFDVSDPEQPERAWIISGFITGAAVTDSYVYVADYDEGLRIVDFSNPAHPSEVGFYDIAGYPHRIVAVGNYAYVIVNGGFWIIDVLDPAQPSKVGYYDITGYPKEVTVVGNYAYVIVKEGGLHILDVSNAEQPIEIGFYDNVGPVYRLVTLGSHIYLDDRAGLHILDASDPAEPTEVGSYLYGVPYPYIRGVLAAAENYVYISDGDSVRIVDISDPTQPMEIGSYNLGARPDAVAVAGSYIYVATGFEGLHIIDVSDPEHPTGVGFYDAPPHPEPLAVQGNHVYFGNGPHLAVLDVSDPTNPELIGQSDELPGSVADMVVTGTHAYIAASTGLHIFDISNPAHPFEVGFYDIQHTARHVAVVEGQYACITFCYPNGLCFLRVIDISDPAHTAEIGRYDLLGSVEDLAMVGGHIYLATEYGGLVILLPLSHRLYLPCVQRDYP